MNSDIVQFLHDLQEWDILHGVANKSLYVVGVILVCITAIVILTRKMKVPVVVGYVFLGMILSSSVLQFVPFLSPTQKEWYAYIVESFDYIADLALAFISFTIGSELAISVLKSLGRTIFVIALLEALLAFVFVTGALLAIGQSFALALLLGAIASATAPAATVMVLREYNAEGPLTSTLLAVVGIDDAVALAIFSFAEPIAVISAAGGAGKMSFFSSVVTPVLQILGAVTMGLLIGYLSLQMISRFEDKTLKVLTFVTTVISCSAIAVFFDVSPLIANMFVGFTYRNFAKKNLGLAEDMDTLTIPLYAMFFTLAGTKIRITSVTSVSFLLIALVYTLARIFGKVAGASVGARISNAPDVIKKYLGFGLLSQIGVGVAMAYTIQRDLTNHPTFTSLIFDILLFTTAITEVIGPFATRYAVFKSGEAKQ